MQLPLVQIVVDLADAISFLMMLISEVQGPLVVTNYLFRGTPLE